MLRIGTITSAVKNNYQAYITREVFCELAVSIYEEIN